jgi:hypothetical protein
MVRHLTVEADPAEPPVGQVHVDLFAHPPFRADAVAVANDQHPDHQLGIDRRAAHGALVRRQVRADFAEFPKAFDRAQQMIRQYVIFQAELVKQRCLIVPTLTHHRHHLRQNDRSESAVAQHRNRTPFQQN